MPPLCTRGDGQLSVILQQPLAPPEFVESLPSAIADVGASANDPITARITRAVLIGLGMRGAPSSLDDGSGGAHDDVRIAGCLPLPTGPALNG